jgi:succinoglycan biosynthesis protein ExoM
METPAVDRNLPLEDTGLADDVNDHRLPHICVCICTYKRPQMLSRLLRELRDQVTDGYFSYSIVVGDNDYLQSAESVVRSVASTDSIPIHYCVEPRQNISLVRNKVIDNARGDFVALIDDDEFPTRSWLLTLLKTCHQYGVDGVLGPVKRHFDEEPPSWVIEGNFYERQVYPTGTVLQWKDGRTGNTLLKKELFAGGSDAFGPQFRGGEDQDFFRRMIEAGHTFIWCDEAVAYEVVPPARWRLSTLLKRALLRGAVTLLNPNFGMRDVAKSVIAIPVYTAALPIALMLGRHRFIDLLVRLFDHLGKILALVGVNPIKEPYVTDQ